MRYRCLVVLMLCLSITVSTVGTWIVSAEGFADDAAQASEAGKSKKGDASLSRSLAAPFKAIGRLFGGKRTKQRQTETVGSMKGFESAATTRITDARSQAETVSIAPSDASGETPRELLTRGREMLARNRLSEAIALLSLAASLDGSIGEAHNLLAVAYDLKGLPQAAKDAYERALRASPDDPQVLNNYGYFLYRQGDYRAAKERLKRAARLAPTDQKIWNNLGLAQFRLEKYDDACKSFVKSGGELKGRLNLAALLERAGHDKEAVKYYEDARRLNPLDVGVLRQLIALYNRLGRSEDTEAARGALALLQTENSGTVAAK